MFDGYIKKVRLPFDKLFQLFFQRCILGRIVGKVVFCYKSLLWVRWKPDGEVDIDSGQAEILPIHSVVVRVSWIWSSEAHRFMCCRSLLVRASTSGGKKVPSMISSDVWDEAPKSIHLEKGGTVGNVPCAWPK